jgi:hypothetical protein
MSQFLQVFIVLAVAALTVTLCMFLIQARKTAQAMERLAESARCDIKSISEDVHEVRLRVDELAAVGKKSLDLPVALGQMASEMVQAIPSMFRKSEPIWLTALGAVMRGVMPFFRK